MDLEKLGLGGGAENWFPCAVQLVKEDAEHAVSHGGIGNQFGVEAGNGHVRLRKHHFDVSDQILEQRKSLEHCPQQPLIRKAVQGVSNTEPARQSMPAL